MRVMPGARIPRFYGVAWRDFCNDVAICYPVPFNWIARWARNAWYLIKVPRSRNRMEVHLELTRLSRELREDEEELPRLRRLDAFVQQEADRLGVEWHG